MLPHSTKRGTAQIWVYFSDYLTVCYTHLHDKRRLFKIFIVFASTCEENLVKMLVFVIIYKISSLPLSRALLLCCAGLCPDAAAGKIKSNEKGIAEAMPLLVFLHNSFQDCEVFPVHSEDASGRAAELTY